MTIEANTTEETTMTEIDNETNSEEGPAVTEKVTTVDTLTDLITRIEFVKKTVNDEIKTIVSDLKNVRKTVTKLERKKNNRRNANPDKPRAPSGITRPTKVSEELRDFLGLEEGELIPRTEVTKRLSVYIAENGLKKPEDKRQILPKGEMGEKLFELLNPDLSEPLTFFNLQTYLKPHFIKTPSEVAEPAEPAVAEAEPEAKVPTPVEQTSSKSRNTRRVRKTRKQVEAAAAA